MIAPLASRVCSVVKTRCPVSAALSAICAVSRSRISPTRITSGSCRRPVPAARRRTVSTSRPTSRCVTTEFGRPREQVLDRLLDGDDAVAAGLVEQVDDHRQRGRLAGAGRPGDDRPARRAGTPAARPARRGKPAQSKSGMAAGMTPQARRRAGRRRGTGWRGTGPACRPRSQLEREVDVVLASSRANVSGGHSDRSIPWPRRRRAALGQLGQVAVEAQDGRVAGDEVQVRRPGLDRGASQARSIAGTGWGSDMGSFCQHRDQDDTEKAMSEV